MWVLTAAGDMVNVGNARRISLESDFNGDEMKIVAYFGMDDSVALALIRRDGADNMRDKAAAMYRALIAAVRDGDDFCDLSYA